MIHIDHTTYHTTHSLTCACACAHRWTPFQHNSTTHNATPQDLLDATNFAIQTPEVKVKVWGKDGKAELLDGMSFAKRCRRLLRAARVHPCTHPCRYVCSLRV